MIMPNVLIMDYSGVKKIISGGQCGVDRGGLEAARSIGLPTGGTAPKGWRTWYGAAPELADFGLTEHESSQYPPRTQKNVYDADATLILASNVASAGTSLTVSLCRKHSKPFHIIQLPVGNREQEVDEAVSWIKDNHVEVLNIAGNRDTGTGEESDFHLHATIDIVSAILQSLKSEHLLATSTE